MDPAASNAALGAGYRRWAETEARGSSAHYESWALAVAESPEVLDRIGALPTSKRQPNLVFAAARLRGAPTPPAHFVPWLIENWSEVAAIALTRATQTNEAARSAVLMVALSRISGPISLIELGASAGLCLIPDRYTYCYTMSDRETLLSATEGSGELTLECVVDGTEPPDRMPEIVWRAGLDLHPVDLSAPEESIWMETLIWPEHDDRRDRLRRAMELIRDNPPRIHAGDLTTDLLAIVADAPHNTTVVVMHSAVFAYLDAKAKAAAESVLAGLDVRRVSLEGVGVLPEVSARLPPQPSGKPGDFLLALDGVPLGYAAPHGGRFTAL